MSDPNPLKIGFALYPDFALIDVMGPFQVLGFTAPPHPELLLVAETLAPVTSFPRVTVTPTATFADCAQLDILVVPGGADPQAPTTDQALLDFVRKQAPGVKYLLSVCVGALIVGAAGLLEGKLATSHWASLGSLGQYPGVVVAGGYPRYVVDGNLITTGGLSSGLDGAIALVAMLRGAEEAKAVELALQYAPKPPFVSGDPDQAEPQTIALAYSIFDHLMS